MYILYLAMPINVLFYFINLKAQYMRHSESCSITHYNELCNVCDCHVGHLTMQEIVGSISKASHA